MIQVVDSQNLYRAGTSFSHLPFTTPIHPPVYLLPIENYMVNLLLSRILQVDSTPPTVRLVPAYTWTAVVVICAFCTTNVRLRTDTRY